MWVNVVLRWNNKKKVRGNMENGKKMERREGKERIRRKDDMSRG